MLAGMKPALEESRATLERAAHSASAPFPHSSEILKDALSKVGLFIKYFWLFLLSVNSVMSSSSSLIPFLFATLIFWWLNDFLFAVISDFQISISQVLENTAFLADLSVRFPDVVTKTLKKDRRLNTVRSSIVEYDLVLVLISNLHIFICKHIMHFIRLVSVTLCAIHQRLFHAILWFSSIFFTHRWHTTWA